MRYLVVNEKYSAEPVAADIDELRGILRDIFGDTETELVERADGVYEVQTGELVAEPVE
jgi:hypothetical protein